MRSILALPAHAVALLLLRLVLLVSVIRVGSIPVPLPSCCSVVRGVIAFLVQRAALPTLRTVVVCINRSMRHISITPVSVSAAAPFLRRRRCITRLGRRLI